MRSVTYIPQNKGIFAEHLPENVLEQVSRRLRKYGLEIVIHDSEINELIFSVEKLNELKVFKSKVKLGSKGSVGYIEFVASYSIRKDLVVGMIDNLDTGIELEFESTLKEGKFEVHLAETPVLIFHHKE